MVNRLVFLLLSGLLAAAFAAPATAAKAKYRPDARIKTVCKNIPKWQNCNTALVGDNVYNATAKNQKRGHTDFLTSSNKRDPKRVNFKISIQNDGTLTDRFTVDAAGVTSGYVVKFFRNSKNITAAIEAGTYTTPAVKPGAKFVIKGRVIMPCDSFTWCGQDRASRLVTVRSVGNSAKRDAVMFTRKVWTCAC